MAGRPKDFDEAEALEAAMGVFWAKGFEGASMEELLGAMGIGRQSVYDTFGGKRELFLAALRAYIGKRSGEIVAGMMGARTPLEGVKVFLKCLRERTRSRCERGCLITNSIIELAPHDAEVREITSNLLRRLEGVLTERLTAAVKEGELAERPTPRQLARLIVVVLEGVLVMSKTELAEVTGDAIASVELMLRPPE
jgi:TetR/AcrR family transcriptional regulator, transcriptional repressor for nem operon